ncbi:MAG: hypothetical protein KatS3mg111_3420 [Pirellulaceae bacterium]|nr:MAG: hypothetical protein KatS3mg111_3420 [Pirellulaceae bacterium]
MKRALFGLSLALVMLSSTGCELLHRRHCNPCRGNLGCRPCPMGWQRGGTDYQSCLGRYGHHAGGTAQVAGPGAAQVAYPYYTTRGPRDFFVDDPPTIGR